jgi:hypothetical protein
LKSRRKNTRNRNITRKKDSTSGLGAPTGSVASGSSDAAATEADSPSQEIGNDGTDARIKSAVDTLLSRSLMRDEKTGRFKHGAVKHGANAEGLFSDLASLKAELVQAVRVQLAADHADAPPTLLAIVDAFCEAHLLRKATWFQLASRGGPVTSKGRLRGLLSAWSSFFDKELRAAERLGLQRLTREVSASPRDWLMQHENTATPTSEESSQ